MGKNSAVYSASGGVAVTPSDSTILPNIRALFVGGAGNVAVTFNDGSAVTLTGVLAGSLLPIQVQKVMLTNTTATNIVALY
jgi:hypothetical protein